MSTLFKNENFGFEKVKYDNNKVISYVNHYSGYFLITNLHWNVIKNLKLIESTTKHCLISIDLKKALEGIKALIRNVHQ